MESSSPQSGPRSLEWAPASELLPCFLLFAVGVAINLALVHCANAQSWLTGEEASVAFKDVVFLRLRLQHDRFDTNLGGHIIYFLAQAIHPNPGIWYGRETKAILMALAGPLTYLFARRLGLGRVPSVFSAVCLLLFPGFSSFSWIGMEAGLDVLFGGLALYLAYGQSLWNWPIAAAALGFGILVYGGAAAFVLPVAAMIGWRVWHDRDRKSLILALVAAGIFVGVLSLPSLWWNNTAHAYRGGATIELLKSPVLFLRLVYESLYKPHSYYFFSTSPSLGGILMLPVLAAGVFVSGRRRALWWPLWLVALGSIGLYSIATPTGVRRAIPLVFVAALLLAEILDRAMNSRQIPRAAAMIGSLVIILLLGGQTFATARALHSGQLVLPHDFDWIGADMKSLEDRRPPVPGTKDAVLGLENPIRAMCLYSLLQERRQAESPPLFRLEEIRDYYLTADPEKYK